MAKILTALLLLAAFVGYSGMVYTKGTRLPGSTPSAELRMAAEGKRLYQEYNCASCHQLYGLGGYLGPDLTDAWSDPQRGPAYLRALLETGGSRMPNFQFTGPQVAALLAYLRYVDQHAPLPDAGSGRP